MTAAERQHAAATRIEVAGAELVELSHGIHAHPEPAFAERHASTRCAELLAAAGFTVETGMAGLPTAVRAVSGDGPLRVAFCAEYDALPGIGHACGHNIICAAWVGAALGAAAVAGTAGLTVILLGTPGEELFGLRDIPPGITGGGKAMLLAAGGFDGVHAALMCHPAPVDIAAAPSKAITRIRARFPTAETGTAPHLLPQTALLPADQALTICQAAAMALQSRAPAGCTIHLVEATGCWTAGTGEDRASSIDFAVWGNQVDDVETVAAQLETCARSAAAAAGTGVEVQRMLPYAQLRHDPDLTARYQANAIARGRTFSDLGALADQLGYATDLGTVSHRIPAIHPFLGIPTQALNHQPEFTAACATPAADRAILDGAITLAWTAIDAATTPALRDRLLSAHPLAWSAQEAGTGSAISTCSPARASR